MEPINPLEDIMDLLKIRHHLHQYPEISCEEKETQRFVVQKLRAIGVPSIHKDFFKTAILAEIDSGNPGKTVLFRSELDALPIQDINDHLSYRSRIPGKSHKCGHDGHMTILIGLAEKLIRTPPKRGKVLLLFQPGEEDGRGARGILHSKKLEQFNINFIFALHNIPKYPFGQIICKPGSFTPSVESLDVTLIGKTAHAGMPWAGINPAATIGKLMAYYQSLHQPEAEEEAYFLSTPIQIEMGERAYGVSAGLGRMGYTFRAYNYDYFIIQKAAIVKRTKEIIQETKGLTGELAWTQGFEANKNDQSAYQLIKEAACALGVDFKEKEVGFSWGEDFGRFTQHYTGAMFGIGAGEDHPDLHNPDYDFPDDLLEPAITIFYELSQRVLKM